MTVSPSDQIKRLRLDKRVTILPAATQISQHYQDADVFCMTSKWEGFPNALAEAMAFGLPAIGYNTCAGVNILIKDGTTGLLVTPDERNENLANGLETLMNNPELHEKTILGTIWCTTSLKVLHKWDQLAADISKTTGSITLDRVVATAYLCVALTRSAE